MKKYPSGNQRNNHTAPLKEVFEELLEAYRLKDTFSEKTVIQEWEQLMGKTVASRTQHLSIRQKVLYAKISSGPLKKEMMLNKSKILQLIERKYGKGVVNDVAFL
jgi:predicted nucleic acid-binding Zn ribbon protein